MRLNRHGRIVSLALALLLLFGVAGSVWAQVPLTQMRNVAIQVLSVTAGLTADDVTTTDDVVVGDDLTVVGDAAVTGDTALTGNLAVTADITAGAGTAFTPQGALTLTMNGYITPTGVFQPVQSAGAVSISGANIAPGADGDLLILFNGGGQTITITETTGLISAGNITLGALDSATLVYSDTTWIQIGASNN